MTIILFLVDTSSSMCQKAYVNGVQKSYLDIAKGAVETFLKYRQRTQDCLGDRYMLLTFEEPPANVKAGWKENHATFMNELKNLQSTGLTSMGESLKNAFDLLNLNRMQSGIDTYGQGRCPFYLEPSVIIVITDGGRYSYRNGVHQEIILPLNTQIPGTKFTKEPFRWDQRLFSLVLRMSGNKVEERAEGKVPHDDSPIERMCEVTGGRSYRVRSHYVLNQCIESLVQKVQPGVVLQFEPMLPRDNNETLQDIVFQPTKKMIYVPKHVSQKTFPIGYWPLPEPYWPDPKAVTLPPRDAHPKLKIVMPAVDEPQMVRNFPVDKYEIEASPLTLQILQKREMNKCWQVIISNGMHGFELPFGYLKASPNFTQVHLYVLAYNYPALLPLLHDLIHKYNMSPPNDLMYKFNAYVRSIPPYYCPFLRKALLNISVPYPLLQFLLPENADNYLSPNIANQLKHIKNTAKQDQENLCMKVYKQLKQPKPPYRQVETAKLNPGVPLRRELVRHPLLRDTFAKLHAEIEPIENYTIVVPQLTRQASAKSYRNPFDIPRRDLIEEIARMRETFLRPTPTSLVAKDSGHCLPIAEMGNYQEYLKNKDNPLREIEPTNVRQHMFGNPYKKDKHMVMVDEADLSDVAPMKSNNGSAGPPGVPGMVTVGGGNGSIGIGPKKIDTSRVRKRKAGPIRKDFVFRRNSMDVRTNKNMTDMMSLNASYAPLSDFEDDTPVPSPSMMSSLSEPSEPTFSAPFDFGEEESVDQDFPLNGYVRNFINGVNDESSCDSEMSSVSTASSSSSASTANANSVGISGVLPPPGNLVNANVIPALTAMNGGNNNNGLTNMLPQQPVASVAPLHAHIHPHPYAVPYGQPLLVADSVSTPATASVVGAGVYVPHQLNGNAYNNVAATNSSTPTTVTASAAAAVAGNAPAAATPMSLAAGAAASRHHNDINDAQEISRILQQCHNGPMSMSATANSSSPSTSASLAAVSSSNFELYDADVKIESNGAATPPYATTPTNVTNALTNNNSSSNNNFDNLKRESMVANTNHVNSNYLPNHNHIGGADNINSNSSNNNNNINSNSNYSDNHSPVSHNQRQTTPTPQVLPTPSPPPLTEEQRELARKHNLEIRAQVFRDIRRPGRNYTQLLEHLNLIKGDDDMKSNFIQMCINESLRFRRKQMINSIQEWWEKKQQQQLQQQQQQQQQQQYHLQTAAVANS